MYIYLLILIFKGEKRLFIHLRRIIMADFQPHCSNSSSSFLSQKGLVFINFAIYAEACLCNS